MKDNITTIEWFQVADALPCPGKPVLVSNGGVASISHVESISVHPDGKGWDVTWKDRLAVIKWCFLPETPDAEVQAPLPAQNGPSVW